jgi:hypothetical protein
VTPDPRLRAGLALLFSVIVVGTGGYVLIEDMAFVDAFYMTAITVSTVGLAKSEVSWVRAARFSPWASSSSEWEALFTLPL